MHDVIIVGGSSGVQTLALSSRTLTISGIMTVKANGAFVATSSTVAGAGALVNLGVLNLKGTSVTTTGGLDNQATVIANAAVSVTGTLTTSAGSLLRLLADGSTGFSTFTSANSFTNNGAIEMTTATSSYSATLAVSGSNTLTNAPGGTITSLVGTGGTRTIDAQLANQGTLTLAQPLTLTHAGAAHTSSASSSACTSADDSDADTRSSACGALSSSSRKRAGASAGLTGTSTALSLACALVAGARRTETCEPTTSAGGRAPPCAPQ